MARNWIIESAVETDEVIINDAGSPVNFRIEGDTDSNLFVVNAKTDKVGIGTASPEGQFDVISASTDESFHVINGVRYGNTKYSAHISVRKARGTASSPQILSWDANTASLQDDIGAFFGEAWDGTKFIQSGGMTILSDGQYSSNVFGTNTIPSRVNLNVNAGSTNGTTPVFSVSADKRAVVGDLASYGGARKKPGSTLEVLGTLKLLKGDGTATTASADNTAAVDEIITSTTGTGASNTWADDQLATAKLVHDLFATTNDATDMTVTGLVANKIIGRITNTGSGGTMTTFNMWSYDGGEVHIGDTVPPASHQYTFGVKGTVGMNGSLYVGGNTTAGEFGDSNTHKDVDVTFKSDTADKDFKWDGGNNSLTLGTEGGATKGVDFTVHGDKDGTATANRRYMKWDADGNTDGNLTIAAANIQMAHTSDSHITPIGAGSGLTNANDIPLVVQAHASNTDAKLTSFRDQAGSEKAYVDKDGSLFSGGNLTLGAATSNYINLRSGTTPSGTSGAWINRTATNAVAHGASGINFIDTDDGNTYLTLAPHATTGNVTFAGNNLREVLYGSAAENVALRINTSSAIADARMTEDANNYRGIYTSNLKIDNNDGVIEAIGADTNESITLRAKAAGTVTIGGTASSAVNIGTSGATSTVLGNLTVSGTLTAGGGTSGFSISGLDSTGTDDSTWAINKDHDEHMHLGTYTQGVYLSVLKANGSTLGGVYAKGIMSDATLTLQTESNGDINLHPNGSGNVTIGTASNNANLTVNGTLSASSIAFTGIDLNGNLDIESQSTTIQLASNDTDSLVIRESSSGTSHLEFDTQNDIVYLMPSVTTDNAKVSIFGANATTGGHDFIVYGRSASEYFLVTADDDLHGNSDTAATSVIGMPFFVGYDTSNYEDVTIFGASGAIKWTSAMSTLEIGGASGGSDYCDVTFYGNDANHKFQWSGINANSELYVKADSYRFDPVGNVDFPGLNYSTSTNSWAFGGDSLAYVNVGVPLIFGGSQSISSATVNDLALSENVIVADTSSNDIALSGIVQNGGASSWQRVVIVKSSASNYLTLKHNATSSAANQISTPDGQDWTLKNIGSVTLFYDNGTDKWLIEGETYDDKLVTITATDAITKTEHAERNNLKRVNLLGEVGGNALVTLTLPHATGSGDTYKFVVSVVNTSNYVIKVVDADHTFGGQIIITDADGTAATSYIATGTDDTITLNGTTTGGGQIGDYIELIDIAEHQWAVSGMVTCPAGSNIADMFSATVS